jgi:hypothetical protein
MPAESNHPVFSPPADPNVKIWRYMDLSKYVSLLENAALFFPRVDSMDDPYEGATSHANKCMRSAVYNGSIPPSVFAARTAHLLWERQWTFINCWHMNEHESDAMWRLYARTTDAVAIQSTYARLHKVLPCGTQLGIVKYIDYNTDWMPEGNSFYPFMHKRKSFEHERELRALIQDTPLKPDPNGSAASVFDYDHANQGAGRMVSVRLQELVETIYIAPTAQTWFRDIVKGVTAKYQIDLPVEQSALDQSPEF